MEPITFTPEIITAISGVVLALFFAYFPIVRVKYGKLASEIKSLIMVFLLLVVAGVIWLLVYYGVLTTTEPITWFSFIKLFFLALISNQPAYTILPQTSDVRTARMLRKI